MSNRWQNQEEAYNFAMRHSASMLDMEMGTGKTRVALDVAMDRPDVTKILVVCPKAVIPVWRENLLKFYDGANWICWDDCKGSIKTKTESLKSWFNEYVPKIKEQGETPKQFVILNYDCVWRGDMGNFVYGKVNFDMVILDESHRAKAAGSKVSKFLALLGRKVVYKMCLSGTPMANSPLDVYGQYRFLDPTIFGTRYDLFLQEYAIMGGPERNFVVGFKNQRDLNKKFSSIAYTCKMSEIADRIKLPAALPPTRRTVELPSRDMKTLKEMSKEFIAECGSGHVIANNVLVKMLRMQQICSGFCQISNMPGDDPRVEVLNDAKYQELLDILSDMSPWSSVVVFCVFRHDIGVIKEAARKSKREAFEISGTANELEEWKQMDGGVLVVQIQAGSEGIDMTKANHAIYYSVPHSLAMYEQSKARLYRPGQTRPVSFCHLVASGTIDEAMYKSLLRKEDVIESIRSGSFDFGYLH